MSPDRENPVLVPEPIAPVAPVRADTPETVEVASVSVIDGVITDLSEGGGLRRVVRGYIK